MKTILIISFFMTLQTQASNLVCREDNGDMHLLTGAGTNHITFSNIRGRNLLFNMEADLRTNDLSGKKNAFSVYEQGPLSITIPNGLVDGSETQGTAWINFDRDDSDDYDDLGSRLDCHSQL